MRNLTLALLLVAAPAAAAPALDSARAALASGGNHAYDGMAADGSAVAFAAPSSRNLRFDKSDAKTPSLKAEIPSRGLAKSRGRRAGFFKKLMARCGDWLDRMSGVGMAAMIAGLIIVLAAGVVLAASAGIGWGLLAFGLMGVALSGAEYLVGATRG